MSMTAEKSLLEYAVFSLLAANVEQRDTFQKDSLVGPYLREADMRSAEGKETELKWQINAPAMSRSVKAIVDSAFRKGAEPLSPLVHSSNR